MSQPLRIDEGEPDAVELDPRAGQYPDLSRVLAYWETKRAGRIAPRRADIDPADLIEVLPRIMLADVRYEPLAFRYRLSGTGILDVHGRDLTGRGPRDLTPAPYGALVHQQYCDAVLRREPLLHLIVLDSLVSQLSYVRLLLPLSEDGSTITMLMAVDGKEKNTRALRQFFAEVAERRAR